ncbi:MAG: inosine/xanthosine triphosphatase [Patescibacteria group bacterium]|nr:inosine/xanthosine triphosphatase [Patescibacteria group bacterium]
MKVVVGSKNPVKIEAVRLAFQTVWPKTNWNVSGIDVASGVSHQPMSSDEAIRGAENRARNAMAQADADYGVGMEGGFQRVGEHGFSMGWTVVADRRGNTGIGASLHTLMPPQMVGMLESGMELGAVDDKMFGRTNSKQGEGFIGLMTNGLITRTTAYRDGVIAALSRFLHLELFDI